MHKNRAAVLRTAARFFVFYCKDGSQSAAPMTVANCDPSGIRNLTPKVASNPSKIRVMEGSVVRLPVSTTFLILKLRAANTASIAMVSATMFEMPSAISFLLAISESFPKLDAVRKH